tara:strand:- start:1692 stop:2282 length:591 start_codon:yes stop_codon:yes gene_type:complete
MVLTRNQTKEDFMKRYSHIQLQGFTLIELTITTIIIFLIINLGASNFDSMLERSKAQNGLSILRQQVNAARQYAISNSNFAVLCPSLNQKDCINNWKASKILFLDTNNNKKRDNNEVILRQFEAIIDKEVLIKYPKTQIRFNQQGIANFYNGTLSYCLNDIVKGLVISRLGRIRLAQDLNGDNIPDININSPVKCK